MAIPGATTMTPKEALRRLMDQLTEEDAERLLALAEHWMADPLLSALNSAPEDDEPTTPDEDALADEAWQDYHQGEYMSAETAKATLLR